MPEPTGPALDVAADALAMIAAGDLNAADRRIRQAAHNLVTPVDLALAFHALGRQEAQP